MADAIEINTVTSANLDAWGVEGAVYTVIGANGKPQTVDFQDLMVAITARRATTVEKEIEPMSTRMRKRNARLEELGNALSTLSGIEASFKSEDAGDTWSAYEVLDEGMRNLLDSLRPGLWGTGHHDIQKSKCEEAIQLVKTQIDKLNNESSSDMTRLQSLVDRRDESYSTATSLMQKVGDTRSAIIRGM